MSDHVDPLEVKVINDHFMQSRMSTFIAEQELKRQESRTSLNYGSVNAILDLSNAFSKQKWLRDTSSGDESEIYELPHLLYRDCTDKNRPSDYSQLNASNNDPSAKEIEIGNCLNSKRRCGSVKVLINSIKVGCASPMRIQSDSVLYGGNPLRHKRRGCIVQAMLGSDSLLDLTSSKRRKK